MSHGLSEAMCKLLVLGSYEVCEQYCGKLATTASICLFWCHLLVISLPAGMLPLALFTTRLVNRYQSHLKQGINQTCITLQWLFIITHCARSFVRTWTLRGEVGVPRALFPPTYTIKTYIFITPMHVITLNLHILQMYRSMW